MLELGQIANYQAVAQVQGVRMAPIVCLDLWAGRFPYCLLGLGLLNLGFRAGGLRQLRCSKSMISRMPTLGPKEYHNFLLLLPS